MRLLILTLLFPIMTTYSQLRGVVLDVKGKPLFGVNVLIIGTDKGTTTSVDGKFNLDLSNGKYSVKISSIGYKTQNVSVTVNSSNKSFIKVILKEDQFKLKQVTIYSKTKSQIVREQSYAVEPVEMKGLKNISTDVGAVIGKVSGVNLRQSGGLGSTSNFSLNGFYGGQVRFFIDGIPMHYFGTSLNLNNFPSNLVDRIEVYKGVVPIHLSSDALGGAINVITNSKSKNFLDATFSYGSFNTNRLALNGQYRYSSGLTFRLKSFYNYSDNDYKVPVLQKDLKTEKWFRRFHDAYSSYMLWAEVGFTKTKFADELFVGTMLSSNYKQIQNIPTTIGATTPFGEVFTDENKIIYNLSYKKKNIIPNLSTSAYMVALNSDSSVNDVSDYTYDWSGNKKLRALNSLGGESGMFKTQLKINNKNFLANINNEYKIDNSNNVAINYSLNSLRLKGSDDFKTFNNVRFKNPSYMTKQIVGLSYTNKIGSNFKSSIFGKYYNYSLNSTKSDYTGSSTKKIQSELDDYGFGLTMSYFLGKFQLKSSYESCIRFPEIVELFGDGLQIKPNLDLQPEKSQNVNLGFIYNNSFNKHNFLISINGFYREGINYIYPSGVIFIRYINALTARTIGSDFSLSYNYNKKYLLNFNGSYNKKVNNAKWANKEKTYPNVFYNIRFPNEPYLFWNAIASYRESELFYKNDDLTFSLGLNYTHSFSYDWGNIGKYNKYNVPKQETVDLELVYSLMKNKYNFSLGVKNLTDETVYDNFNQVKPGRTMNFKLRYFIN